MTINLKETTQTDQVLLQGAPEFKGRAIIAYGNGSSQHDVLGHSVGMSCWGALGANTGSYGTLADDIFFGFETGGSTSSDPSPETLNHPFYAYYQDGTGIPVGSMSISAFGCGEVDLVAALDVTTLFGLFVLGGKTLETHVGKSQFTSTGPHSVTGVGFQPDLVLIGSVAHNFWGSQNANPGPFGLMFGAFDAEGNQFVGCGSGYYLVGGLRYSRFSNNACFQEIKGFFSGGGWQTSLSGEASFVSMDADGFTVDVRKQTDSYWWYMAIKDPGGYFRVGTATEGDTTISPGARVDAMMFHSSGATMFDASSSPPQQQQGNVMSFGGCDSKLRQFGGFGGGSNPGDRANYWTDSAIVLSENPSASFTTVAVDAVAEVTSWGNNITLDWTTGGTGGILFGWVAMKTSNATGFEGCGFIPDIYRYGRAIPL